MRKVRWGSILLGLMMLLTLLTVTAFAAETTVAATDNAAANGQALVDAVSQASEGDTIVISAGTYDLPKNTYHSSINGDLAYGLLIDKSITLKSAGDGEVVLTSEVGGYSSGMVLFTKYDVDVIIDGITFEGSSWDLIGCDDPGVRNVAISNCKFDTGASGATPIKLKLLTGTISNNVFTGTDSGYGVRIIPIDKRETSWGGAENVPQNLTVDITISENDFSGLSLAKKDRGIISVNTGDSGVVSISEHDFSSVNPADTGYAVQNVSGNVAEIVTSRNYWGDSVSDISQKITGTVTVDTYYTDADMTQTETVGGIPVTTADELAAAIANAQPGDTIVFLNDIETTTALEITKDVTIDGNGHKLTANNCVGFYIKGDLNKFAVRDLTLTGVLPDGATAGEGATGSFMGIGNYNQTVDVDLLTLDNVTIEGFSYGLYIGNASKQGKTSVQADNLTIQNCYIKGAYFECLTDSTFTNCKFLNNGTDEAKVEINFQQWMCGVDVNLKYGDFKNIAFNNCVFTGNGDNDGTALHIKARGTGNDSDSYLKDPATLTGVTVSGCTFADNNGEYDIILGEPGKNNTYPVNVSIQPGVAYANNLAQNAYHTVLFVSNGKEVDRRIVADEAELVLPTATLKGYTFMGWKSSADGKVYDAGDTVKIEKDTTFTALWRNNLGIIGDIIGGAVEEKEFFTDVSMGDWYYEAVKFCFDYDLMNGVGNGKFSPDTTLTRAMLAQVLYNLDEARGSYAGVFTDVTGSAWYANAVNWAAASGIVEGKGNNKFDPDAPVTRQEMAAIFYRYASYKGYDVSAAASLDRFTDASKVASWAKDAMSWAVGGYVINGKGAGRLDPTGTATRAEVAQILMNFCNNVL